MAWTGRIEENKNWREFLLIGHKLVQDNPNTELLFEDPTLSKLEERDKFQEKRNRLNIEKNLTIHASVVNKEMSNYFSRFRRVFMYHF